MRRQPGFVYAIRLETYQQTMNVPAEKNSYREKVYCNYGEVTCGKVDVLNVTVLFGYD